MNHTEKNYELLQHLPCKRFFTPAGYKNHLNRGKCGEPLSKENTICTKHGRKGCFTDVRNPKLGCKSLAPQGNIGIGIIDLTQTKMYSESQSKGKNQLEALFMSQNFLEKRELRNYIKKLKKWTPPFQFGSVSGNITKSCILKDLIALIGK